jgi:hypothetical protein
MLTTDRLHPRELGVVRLASPCKVKWSSMRGSDTVRHCGQCRLNVFNAEHLTSFQVRDLVLKAEGRVCMRFFRRFDGTLLTRDCPRGWAQVQHVFNGQKRQLKAEYTIIVALILAAAFTVHAMFGDNIRRLFFGVSTGALAGADPIELKRLECEKRNVIIRAFDKECRNQPWSGPTK